MYAKIFRQIYDSSIADDWQVRVVFEDLLVLATSEGIVDMTHEAVAARTRIPLDIVIRAIEVLEKPDPKSRTPDQDGRRLMRLDERRTWGWVIVNYEKYRAIKCEFDRTTYMRKYMRIKRKRPCKTKSLTQSNKTLTSPSSSSSIDQGNRGVGKEGESPEERIYDLYPRKVGKPAALKAIKKQIALFGFDLIEAATKRFSEAWDGIADLTYCPHPATYYNQERFNDSPETWKNGNVPRGTNQVPKESLAARQSKQELQRIKNEYGITPPT